MTEAAPPIEESQPDAITDPSAESRVQVDLPAEAPVTDPPALDPLGLEPLPAPSEVFDQRTAAPPGEVDEHDAEQTRVRLVLKDGTTATPGLDPESEERLRYILDNIVPPPEGPTT